MNEIMDLIGNIGLPAVLCFYLLKNAKEEAKIRLSETKGFIEAINNNTTAIEKLSIYLKKEGE